MTAKPTIGSMRDSAYMAITETLGLAGEAMEKRDTDVLLVISLSGANQDAVLGGTLNAERIAILEDLLVELKRRAENEGNGDRVLHVWR